MHADPLALPPETMRALGYRVVDALVDRMLPGGRPGMEPADPDDLRRRLHGDPPEGPRAFDELLAQVERDVVGEYARIDHARFFAFVPGSSTWPGALADLISAAVNLHASDWIEAPGPTQLELTVIDWFRGWIGYPEGAGGVLTSGGSMANLTGLVCARELSVGTMSDRVVAYVCDQAHSSVARAARALGFRPDQVRVLPSDGVGRLRPDLLREAIAVDERAGRLPMFVAAAAGCTNTGAVDPLREIADICQEHGVWLHVDGAYGGFAALTERGRRALSGIDSADSVTLDPHKWLYQPYECGCLLVRDGTALRRAFAVMPDYLRDTVGATAREVNFSDLSLQLTRGARALKVWLSLSYFGVAAFRAAIDRCLDLAAHAQRRIEGSLTLELLSPATLGIVCFRRRFDGVDDPAELDRRNVALARELVASGEAFVSSTRVGGVMALRLCVLNHATGQKDVDAVLDWFERADVPPMSTRPPRAGAGVAPFERNPDVEEGWLVRSSIRPSELRALDVFAALDDATLRDLSGWASRQPFRAGEAVLGRWQSRRALFVVRSGTLEVRVGEETVRTIGPGGFFGEMGGMDRGAPHPRTASVVAVEDGEFVVVPPGRLSELMERSHAFATLIRRAAAERLGER